VLTILVLIPAFLVGSHWGLTGVSLSWALGYPLLFVITNHRACRVIGMRSSAIFKAMWRPALAATLMHAAVASARVLAPATMVPVVRLVVFSSIGAVVFAGLFILLYRDSVEEALGFLGIGGLTRRRGIVPTSTAGVD
jgi:hypothetical protein